jgi:GNAT superfamily N-acetyltransferase
MRKLYRREMNCQIVHDSYHERGFTDSYAITIDGKVVGYGSIAGPVGRRSLLKEFFVYPEWRNEAVSLLRNLIEVSGATTVETQTNDPLLAVLFWDVATNVTSDTILFADAQTTNLDSPGAEFRRIRTRERSKVFAHTVEPIGDWGLEREGHIVATGGVMYHYNAPYGDIYMEVAERHRRVGLGSYLVQELKRIAYEGGHTPAARCNRDNTPSRRALERAGMLPCGRILNPAYSRWRHESDSWEVSWP